MLRASPRQLNPSYGYVEPVDRFAIFRLGGTLRYVASRRADQAASVIDVRKGSN